MAAVTTVVAEMRPAPTPAPMRPSAAPIGTPSGARPCVGKLLATSGRSILLVLLAQPTPETWMHFLFFLLPGLLAPGGA
jgi:hypothetical protein